MNPNYNNDRFDIFRTNEDEVRELAKKLNLSVDDILIAIQEVGFNEEDIEEYIRDRQERG